MVKMVKIRLKIKVASFRVCVCCGDSLVCRVAAGVSSRFFFDSLLCVSFFFIRLCIQQQCPPSDLSFNFDANKQQRQLIAELENKNR